MSTLELITAPAHSLCGDLLIVSTLPVRRLPVYSASAHLLISYCAACSFVPLHDHVLDFHFFIDSISSIEGSSRLTLPLQVPFSMQSLRHGYPFDRSLISIQIHVAIGSK